MLKPFIRPLAKVFLVVSMFMLLGLPEDSFAKDTNPCSKMPRNPCASKNIPVRKNPVKDSAKLKEMSEKLWAATSLGASGNSCATCHPNGAGLKKEPFPKYIKMADDILTTDQMINFCMVNPMKGKPLAWNSQEMTALAAYVSANSKESAATMNPCSMKNPCNLKNPCGMKNPCGARNPCAKKNPCSMKNPCGGR